MGCLNSDQGFTHWFGNIHLSGPCNRRCYFCIGQHMMALDDYDTLDASPLPGLDEFVDRCIGRGITEINVTGTNTDPLLYRHTEALKSSLSVSIEGLRLGVRTNAVANLATLRLYDTGSVTVCSTNPVVYRQMMGLGKPPNLVALMRATAHFEPSLKVNIVLGPENVASGDLFATLVHLSMAGVRRVNLREPYGQPHVGDPMAARFHQADTVYGMALYRAFDMDVLYWDVHTVEVESVNLYASGRVSEFYPITLGHVEGGIVRDQTNFPGGRVQEQWLKSPTRGLLEKETDT